jgi:hypothetical protein
MIRETHWDVPTWNGGVHGRGGLSRYRELLGLSSGQPEMSATEGIRELRCRHFRAVLRSWCLKAAKRARNHSGGQINAGYRTESEIFVVFSNTIPKDG